MQSDHISKRKGEERRREERWEMVGGGEGMGQSQPCQEIMAENFPESRKEQSSEAQ